VYRSTSAGTQGASIGTPTTPSFTDTTAVPGTTYYYGVTASNSGGTSALSVQNSGYAQGAGGGGALSGAVLAVTSPVNLTTVGTSDWAHWYGYDHKATGGNQLPTYTVVGSGGIGAYGDDPRTLSWTDGTPTASGSNRNGVYTPGVGNGFQMTAPADTTTRTLTVYVGGASSTGHLTATLSDGSAAAYVSASVGTGGQYDGAYQLTYRAGGAGQQLIVQWTQVTGTGNVTLQGAALSGAVAAPGVPTNVAASEGTSPSVSVTWTAVSGATSYTVYRSTSAGEQGSSIGTPTCARITVPTGVDGETSLYGVTASNRGGTSALSEQDRG
jgi:hypothetical protein